MSAAFWGWSSNYGTINNSYSTGTVTGNANVGGLLGSGGVTLDNAYYTDTTGQTNGIGSGTPSSGTAQLVTMDGLHELYLKEYCLIIKVKQ